MKKIITISCLFFSLVIKAQVFSGPSGPIQNNGQLSYFPITVSGVTPAQIDSSFGLEQVCFNISHPNVAELDMFLMSPNGTFIQLMSGSSSASGGTDFLNTCLNDQAGPSITIGTSPYSGSFRPIGSMGRFNNGQPVNGTWTLIVFDQFPTTGAGMLISCSIQFGNAPSKPVVFKSSNLPIVFINTSQFIGETKIVGTMGIVDNGTNRNYITDGWNGYNGKVEINVRGSSSSGFEKKSYTFETQDAAKNKIKVPILGMPKEEDWVLSSSYADKTLTRNNLTYDIYRSMGHYGPRHRNVELVVNNEYFGVYSLTEKVKRDSNRVNIRKCGENDNSFPDITGGYIIKIDRPDEPGWNSLFPGNSPGGTKFYYQYVYPKDSSITPQQINYIQGYINNFETIMNSASYADPNTGYPSIIDVASFVDFFIINELSKNVDASRLSTYLYKHHVSNGGKLYIGPVWDYDIAWHNCIWGDSYNSAGWGYQAQSNLFPSPTWWVKFMQDPDFVTKLACRWNYLRSNVLSTANLHSYIDAAANELSESQTRNFKQWPVLGAFIYCTPQNQVGANYSTEIADLKNWITNRAAWLDANINAPCAIGIEENNLVSDLNIYPNPMESSTIFDMTLEKNSDVSLSITDVVGKEVARFINTNVNEGNAKIVFERNQIPAGVYLYQLEVNSAVKTGKIVIQ